MPNTFAAVVVALIALLPGASFSFAYERAVGYTAIDQSGDRLVRFLASSAVFQALYSGPELLLYRNFIATGRLRDGRVPWWLMESAALTYVVVPILVGALVGWGHKRHFKVITAVLGGARTPTAWDWVWEAGDQIVRLKLKSGTWLAGSFAMGEKRPAFASSTPHPADLYLSHLLQINPEDGSFVTTERDGLIQEEPGSGGVLVRWEEIEYLQLISIGGENV